MPDNSTRYGEISNEAQHEILNKAYIRIEEIVKVVRGGEEYFDVNISSKFKTHIHPGILHKFLYKSRKRMDKGFIANEDCTGCGICQRICPSNIITMQEDKPVWNKNEQCQVCLACHDWCPGEAILHPSTKAGIKRYHNPGIKLADMISSSSELV